MTIPIINISTLNGNNGFSLNGEGASGFAYEYSGGSVSGAGDINGDGYDDVMIGAHFAEFNHFPEGYSYVVFGKASGFEAVKNLSTLNGNDGFQLKDSSVAAPNLVSDAGDVNGDGYDDVIIGAQGYYDSFNYTTFEGAGYVVFGKAQGFPREIDLLHLDGADGFRLDVNGNMDVCVSGAGDVNGDGFDDVIIGVGQTSYLVFGKASGFEATVDLTNLDGSDGFRLGEGGFAVSDAGDINGDGFDDILVGIGATGYRVKGQGTGYVVFGKTSGFDPVFDFGSLDGSNGFHFGDGRLEPPPLSISGAGDINGDGFDDIILGAHEFYNFGNHTHYEGSSYVVFGQASGFAAEVDLSSLDGNNGFRVEAEDRSTFTVSSAGDVNGDGFDDLIIGGAFPTYVMFGKAYGFMATFNLNNLDSKEGFGLEGMSSAFGSSISGAGDVNSDGFDDLIIGDPNAGYYGTSYVMFGRSDFASSDVIKGTTEDDILKGTLDGDTFEAGDRNDLMIGRGGADEFHGGAGSDKMNVADLNFAFVDGGSGNDVLHTDGKNLNLDLTDYLDKIKGIETICLYGRGDNTLILTGAELKALSDTTDTLKIHGNDGDRVLLEGSWVNKGSHGYYHTYTQDDAVLLVGMHVTPVLA